MSSASPFPFQHVVITFPDQRAADWASQGPLQGLRQQYPNVTLTATTDPHHTRVGSGGGTLNALETTSQQDSSVLVLHAGGESSRCPTQMVLGKAWTSLPTTSGLKTPIELWLQQCQELFQNIPLGSIVTVASDTLLLLPSISQPLDWDQYQQSSVLGLAVPAALETATNHGVFCLDENDFLTDEIQIRGCAQVLQKPDLETLERDCSFRQQEDGTKSAWIDTGVVVFLPAAAAAIRQLAESDLKACTRQGLEELCQQQGQDDSSIEKFAAGAALKVDLYTHFLQALACQAKIGSSQNRESDYCERYKELPDSVSRSIFRALSPFSLGVVAVPQGRFLHLGTTRELVDFYVQGCTGKELPTVQNQRTRLCRLFGEKLALASRLEAITLLGDEAKLDANAVVYHSILRASQGASIGDGAVIEHSWFETERSIVIGKDCYISSFRSNPADLKDGMRLPDGVFVQKLPLAASLYVIMVLGIDDGTKKKETIYGRSFDSFLRWTGLHEDDLWEKGITNRTLWNAKLHPIVTEDSFHSLYAWLSEFCCGKSSGSNTSLEKWKSCLRLSLAEIRNRADASLEFAFRGNLALNGLAKRRKLHFKAIHAALIGRRHIHIDIQFVVDSYKAGLDLRHVLSVLHELDEVIGEAHLSQLYDVCGRACMVMSAFLGDLARVSPQLQSDVSLREKIEKVYGLEYSNGQSLAQHLQRLTSPILAGIQSRTMLDASSFEPLFRLRDSFIKDCPSFSFAEFSILLESAAHAMTEHCVCDSENSAIVDGEREEPVFDTWVIATAPARIDLSGGWSDTPPICFEYGSAVTGLAVSVDGLKPLSCRCRIVSGDSGVLLRSELRCIENGELLSKQETQLTSFKCFKDYRDPKSDVPLLKCALICLGIVSKSQLEGSSGDLQPLINSFCSSEQSVRLEVVVSSLLPHGSGLGTSSILAGCALAAIGRCVGIDCSSASARGKLIDSVLLLEQHLTTGGGFQDQVNGLIGGAKMVTCEPSHFPLNLAILPIRLDPNFRERLNQCLVLTFTGKTRLAKNILRNVLRRWSKRTGEIVTNVEQLVAGAKAARDAISEGNLDALGKSVSDYWRQKIIMAGEASGVEPTFVRDVIAFLQDREMIRGASLCGAGGGGFMVMLASEGVSTLDIRDALSLGRANGLAEVDSFRWYKCSVCEEGLETKLLPESDIDSFDPSWLTVS